MTNSSDSPATPTLSSSSALQTPPDTSIRSSQAPTSAATLTPGQSSSSVQPNPDPAADQQPDTESAQDPQPDAGEQPQLYTSTTAITIQHPDYVEDDSAVTLKVKPQVRFFFKERPETKKSPVTDPQDPLFRPLVPDTITLKFNIDPHYNLTQLKTIVYQAICPVLGGRAKLEQSKWIVDPPSLVDIGYYVALHDVTEKRHLWFWGTERPPNHPKTHHPISGKFVTTLKSKDVEVPMAICRYGYDVTEQSVFNNFYVAMLSPQRKSHGGFPDQFVHNDIVARLRKIWGDRLDAPTGEWQRWAMELIRLPAHELDTKMREGPPPTLTLAFSSVQTHAERQMQIIHEQSAISHSFLKQITPKIDVLANIVKDLANTLDAVQHEVKALQELVTTQMELAKAYRVSSMPRRMGRNTSAALEAGLSDVSDKDHRSSTDEEDSSEGEQVEGEREDREE